MEKNKLAKAAVSTLLDVIKKDIPVTWDRFTEYNGYYNVYGWLPRSDGQRDFLLLQALFTTGVTPELEYVTSSAKYSAKIHEILYGDTASHINCKKVKELTDE